MKILKPHEKIIGVLFLALVGLEVFEVNTVWFFYCGFGFSLVDVISVDRGYMHSIGVVLSYAKVEKEICRGSFKVAIENICSGFCESLLAMHDVGYVYFCGIVASMVLSGFLALALLGPRKCIKSRSFYGYFAVVNVLLRICLGIYMLHVLPISDISSTWLFENDFTYSIGLHTMFLNDLLSILLAYLSYNLLVKIRISA